LINKVLLLISLALFLNAKESLYLHTPSDLPSKKAITSFGKELINLINNSEETIYFAIYGLRGQDDILNALLDAQKRGVKIKGVVDSDSHGKNYYSDTPLLHKYFDIVSDHKSYIMHNKFFSMVIENKKIANIYLKEFYQMYDGKFGIWKEENSHKNIKTKDSIISVYFSPKSKTYDKAIKGLIQNSKKYIYIPIFYLTHKELSKELIKAHKRGIEIKIILDASAARNKYSMHKILRQSGIQVKVENFGGKMHAKSIIIDDKYFVSGSMNLTKAGNIRNDENTIIVHNEELAIKYKKYFLKLWSSIPTKYLKYDPNPESKQSGNSCYDRIDNDFDHTIDMKDKLCR